MRYLLFAPLLAASPAFAAERTFPTGSFERVRVEGPFRVSIASGSPGARASADQGTLDRLSIEVNGGTLTVRLGGAGWAERPGLAKATVPVITLSTPRLSSVAISAGAEVAVDALAGARADLTITGPGSLAVARADADQLVAKVIGTGTLAIAGRVRSARLSLNGSGAIAAPGLTADAATVRLEGPGEIALAARFTAQVTSSGLGRVTVTGNPKCTVAASAGGPVSCGTGTAR